MGKEASPCHARMVTLIKFRRLDKEVMWTRLGRRVPANEERFLAASLLTWL